MPYLRAHLIQRLRSANPKMARLDAKRLARRILEGEVSEFSIDVERYTQSLRHLLEARGAEVEVVNESPVA